MSFDFGKVVDGTGASTEDGFIPINPENIPQVYKPFDLAPVKAGLSKYQDQLKEMKAAADALEVKNEASNAEATAQTGVAKKMIKELEAKRKEVTADAREFVSGVNAIFKNLTDPLTAITKGLEGKQKPYQTRLVLERRKAEELARKATEDAQAKLNAEAEAAGVQPVQLDAPVAPKIPTTTRTETGTSYTVTTWKHEIIDAAQVPREFCEPVDRLIREAVKGGVREIPGVRIYEDIDIRTRM